MGRRVAFDPGKGRLWAVCTECGRWNLAPLEERWESIEICERLFRATSLRISTDNIGMAELRGGMQLIRIGPPAQRPEIAAWRYGRRLLQHARRDATDFRGVAKHRIAQATERGILAIRDSMNAAARIVPYIFPNTHLRYDALTWIRIRRQRRRVLDVIDAGDGERVIIRYDHLERTELVRPDRLQPWRLRIEHELGETTLTGDAGLRTAGKLLAALNGFGATQGEVQYALAKLEDAGDPDGYFARVAALALRTAWGKNPEASRTTPVDRPDASLAERLALHITNRSFLGRGGIGSEPKTALPLLPLVDRLALEMAANEDAERRAMQGELAELEEAWREAEEIAAISDSMFLEKIITRASGVGRRASGTARSILF
ncbi:MAG: hypothetical protein M3081_19410, partial [Gemmatimonadota bacterium]|nr:hypothetical protein [Gemmatimonadota bacterium]